MPLSDHEQQILQEIEQNLLAEDPSLAGLQAQAARSATKKIRLGALLFVLGLFVFVVFLISSQLLAGLTAFGLMVAGIVLVAGGVRERMVMGFRDLDPRRKISGFFSDIEERFRDRYRRS